MSESSTSQQVAKSVTFTGGERVQTLQGTGTRVNATAGAASTAEAAVPVGGNVIIIRATDAIAIRFGATGMGAAAVDADSILFVGGEAPYVLVSGQGFFRVIRVGATDVAVQLESVATVY
jgi:hypothetical protein